MADDIFSNYMFQTFNFFIMNNWSMSQAHFNQTFGRPIP